MEIGAMRGYYPLASIKHIIPSTYALAKINKSAVLDIRGLYNLLINKFN